jgi:hypothetical protein
LLSRHEKNHGDTDSEDSDGEIVDYAVSDVLSNCDIYRSARAIYRETVIHVDS